jgi:hypothetical protein
MLIAAGTDAIWTIYFRRRFALRAILRRRFWPGVS